VTDRRECLRGRFSGEMWDQFYPSWRYTSIVWVSLDAGLRPDAVASAKTSWVDVETSLLRIPKEDASKNFDNWEVSLR